MPLRQRALFGWLAIAAAAIWGLVIPGASEAARVIVLRPDGHAVQTTNPFVPVVTPMPTPTTAGLARAAGALAAAFARNRHSDSLGALEDTLSWV